MLRCPQAVKSERLDQLAELQCLFERDMIRNRRRTRPVLSLDAFPIGGVQRMNPGAYFHLNPKSLLAQFVGFCDVLAEDGAAPRFLHRRDESAQLFQVVARMIGMRIVARPEEFVLAD